MKYVQTPLQGAYLVELDPRGDERGFFARLFCSEEFISHGLEGSFVQVNTSLSREQGTLRGLHYQLAPAAETKLVRCMRGAVYDVLLDLRPGSSSFGGWFAETLTAENRTMTYVPRGFAHGFLSLEPDTEVIYFVSHPYSPVHERGIRWDDPRFAIEWPIDPRVISAKDRAYPDFNPAWHLVS